MYNLLISEVMVKSTLAKPMRTAATAFIEDLAMQLIKQA